MRVIVMLMESMKGISGYGFLVTLLCCLLEVSFAQAASPSFYKMRNTTDLLSTTEEVISYRHQERSWISADGAQHIIINTGAAQGLVLYSNRNQPPQWTAQFRLPGSDAHSTVDIAYSNGRLYAIYNSADNQLRFASLNYVNQQWQLVTTGTYIEANNSLDGPSIAFETTSQRIWTAFTRKELSQVTIGVAYSDDLGRSWQGTDIQLGNRNLSPQKKGRMLVLPDRIAVIFSDHDSVSLSKNWAYVLLSDPKPFAGGRWVSERILTHHPQHEDYVGSHFSVVKGSNSDIHLMTGDNTSTSGSLAYLRYRYADRTWQMVWQKALAEKMTYMQLARSTSNGRLLMIYPYKRAMQVWSSLDNGDHYSLLTTFPFPVSATAKVVYPRVEAPGEFAKRIMIFIQEQCLDGAAQQIPEWVLYQYSLVFK